MTARLWSIAVLLGGSGFCALIYQIAWLRELRLVFGASTAASAAVLAIFMAGLGLGGAFLGRRADKHPNPLAYYAALELAIALSAAATPFLLYGVRSLYIALGGSLVLGLGGATVLRLALAAVVLGVPTVLMGGTLPAAARAAESAADVARNRVAVLYGVNTLGAVAGAFLSTFWLLEIFGTRQTLWLACLLNVVVALTARSLARAPIAAEQPAPEPAQPLSPAAIFEDAPATPPAFVLLAAGVVGFVFLLMELVWYRMLSPLLGGSTYTFGLILAVALLGIGLGSAAYAFAGRTRPPSLYAFAATVGIEAVFLATPYALGDNLAILAHSLRDLTAIGFTGHVVGWTLLALIVVFPTALVSGYQFPLLIGLLGQGARHVGKHTGLAYACNTAGAILGSLAGGFGALPLLGATGAWKGSVALLALLGAATLLLAMRTRGSASFPRSSVWPAVLPIGALAMAAVLVSVPMGPTALWRHSGIGVGRSIIDTSDRNALIKSFNELRRQIRWEADGIESAVALQANSGWAFILNGKNDGNAIYDASTQVTLGLISAIVHPNPTSAFVIGMGTGSSAGWLAAVDSIAQVDVAELEPVSLEMAQRCADVNHDAMNDPKINIIAGDARELLLTAPRQYDLIVSEPSNPYRAGIASLYTVEFYEAVAKRLSEGGLFSQWVQAYEIDARTFRTIYATLASVFEYVETWQTNDVDLVILCSNQPIIYDVARLRPRIQMQPFADALLYTWGVVDLEGMFSRYIARSEFAQHAARGAEALLNTDDRTLVEYGFARTVGQKPKFVPLELRKAAAEHGAQRPILANGDLNWGSVEDQRLLMSTLIGHKTPNRALLPDDMRHRADAFAAYVDDDLSAVWAAWSQQSREPEYPLELAVVAEALAEQGDERGLHYLARLGEWAPVTAAAINARLLYRTGRTADAVAQLEAVYRSLRKYPWALLHVTKRALELGQEIAEHEPKFAARLLAAVDVPFSVHLFEEYRRELAIALASHVSPEAAAERVAAFEPHVVWTREFLAFRAAVYAETGSALAARAQRDLQQFEQNDSHRFVDLLFAPAEEENGRIGRAERPPSH